MYYDILRKLKENLNENFSTDHEDSYRGCVYLDYYFKDGTSMVIDFDVAEGPFSIEYFDSNENFIEKDLDAFENRLITDLDNHYQVLAVRHMDAYDLYDTYN